MILSIVSILFTRQLSAVIRTVMLFNVYNVLELEIHKETICRERTSLYYTIVRCLHVVNGNGLSVCPI